MKNAFAKFRTFPTWVQVVIAVFVGVMLLGVLAPTEDESKPAVKAKAAPAKPKPKADPLKTLETDVRNNASEETGDEPQHVACSKGNDCTVRVRFDVGWDGKQDETARTIGGVFHELFRDTDVETLTVEALTTTVNPNTGKETKDDEVARLTITRAKWETIDWDNLQYANVVDGLRAITVGGNFYIQDLS